MTTTFNAIFARFENGYIYVDRSGPAQVRELYLELGGITTGVRAREFADAILSASAESKRTVAVSGYTLNLEQIPGVYYAPNDSMGGKLIASLTITRVGENGAVQVVPELEDPGITRLAAIQRRLAAFGSGVTAEFGRPVVQGQDTGTGTDTTPPTFSHDGVLTPTTSPAWKCPRPFQVSWMPAVLKTPGSTPTVCTAYAWTGTFTGSPSQILGTVTIPAGQEENIGFVNKMVPAGYKVTLAITAVGTDAADLTLSLAGAMI